MRRILSWCLIVTLLGSLAIAAGVQADQPDAKPASQAYQLHAKPVSEVSPPPAPGESTVPSPPPSTPPKPATVDELLDKLEKLKTQREAIEKQEAQTKA